MQLRDSRIAMVPRCRSTASDDVEICCRIAISILPPTAASILVWRTALSAFPFYVIIAAHTYAWQAILFCFCSFINHQTNPRQGRAAARDLSLGWTGKIYSDILPTHPINFTWVQNCEILARFSTPVSFDALWIRNETMYRQSKTSTIDRFSFWFRHFAHPFPNFYRAACNADAV